MPIFLYPKIIHHSKFQDPADNLCNHLDQDLNLQFGQKTTMHPTKWRYLRPHIPLINSFKCSFMRHLREILQLMMFFFVSVCIERSLFHCPTNVTNDVTNTPKHYRSFKNRIHKGHILSACTHTRTEKTMTPNAHIKLGFTLPAVLSGRDFSTAVSPNQHILVIPQPSNRVPFKSKNRGIYFWPVQPF